MKRKLWLLTACCALFVVAAFGQDAAQKGTKTNAANADGEFLDPREGAALLKHEGQTVKVKGRIVRFATATKGTFYYLNFAEDFRTSLSLAFRRDDNPAEFRPELLQKYSGKVVVVEGKVTTFSGRPQILIKSLSEIQVQAPSLDGHWEGFVKGTNSERIRLNLDLAKNAKSEWIASMSAPSANKAGWVVTNLVVNGKSVKFVAVELRRVGFDLTLGADGTMTGMASGMRTQAVEFKRTGEAKVKLIATSPAVSKELEGDWEGTLESPNGPFRMAFHFKNQPDHTVAATMDSNDYKNMALDDVKQTGQKVEFAIKIAGEDGEARFEGTLNKEGTELTGHLIHDATKSAPLIMRKK